jgi:serine/threonine protein kinase
MDPERWRQITEIFHQALSHLPRDRSAFLDDACADDAPLRAQVDVLLSGDARAEAGADLFGAREVPLLAPGMDIGPYRIEAALGAGGMGEVYKAADTRLNRTVAIKLVSRAFIDEPERRRRFEREAQAIAALKHPHICVLYDVGRHGDLDFLVMEHLEGETLEHRLARGPLPLQCALQHATELADALTA